MAKGTRNQSKDSQRMNSNRNRNFDTDAGNYLNDEYYRNERSRGQRSDYDFEQMDRPSFDLNRHAPSEFRNSRDFTGNFPSAELSGLGRESSGYDRSWNQNSASQGSGSQFYGPQTNRQYGQQDLYDQQPGAHAGKGPKGYQRSEERIREDVCDALEAHAHIDASEIEVEVSEGVVTLTGFVESRQAKRMAEQAVESVRGIRDIHNELTIEASSERMKDASSLAASTAKNTKSGKKNSANYRQ